LDFPSNCKSINKRPKDDMPLVRQVNPNDFFGEAQNLKETIGLADERR
jgi:hypothetical protein